MNILLPIFLKLDNRPVLVIGGGAVAEQKIAQLLEANAAVNVIAPQVSPKIEHLEQQSRLNVKRHCYRPGEMAGFFLVFGATDDPAAQRQIYEEATSGNIPVNIVDVPELCTFYLSSVFQNGDLKVAVSTNGKSPALGKIIRDRIGAEFSNGYAALLHKLGEMRPRVMASLPDYESRKQFFENMIQAQLHGHSSNGIALNGAPDSPSKGKVYLVGAGPGDPELISVKGLRQLKSAEVVVYDAHIHPELLDQAPPSSEKIYVGKKAGKPCIAQSDITQLLISKGRAGKKVVRLKGGDPFMFGRGGEELEALRDAGVTVEVIPGITAGVGVPTALGLPLTHRRYSSSVAFVTGHEDPTKTEDGIDWESVAAMDTLVVYMGVRRIAQIAGKLVRYGRSPRLPVAVVFAGTRPEQVVITGTLEDISFKIGHYIGDFPGLIVIGEVVRFWGDSSVVSAVNSQQEVMI
jgi:uroporphyrin-III C-methyltransferase/precorrin-2 dehydrogenase/sirohydrochlorin ferrochelatase